MLKIGLGIGIFYFFLTTAYSKSQIIIELNYALAMRFNLALQFTRFSVQKSNLTINF